MKGILLLFTLFYFSLSGFAQKHYYIDSLKQQLLTNHPDSIKARLYLHIGEYYFYKDNDSALLYCARAAHLAKKHKLMPVLIMANAILFVTHGLNRNDVAAIKTFFETQSLVNANTDTLLKMLFLQYAGLMYNTLEDYRTSLNYFLSIAPLLRNASERGYYDAVTSRVISEDYYKLNMLDSALVYANIVLQTLQRHGKDHSVVHRVLGNIYRKKGEAALALKELHKGAFLGKEGNLEVEVIKSHLGLAQTFYAIGNVDSSLYYSNAVMRSPKLNSFAEEKLQTLNLLKDIYRSKNIRDSAYKYTSLVLSFRDSIYNAEKARAVQRVEVEQAIKSREAEAEKAAFQNRVRIYALVAALLVFLLIAIILWRNNQHKQKANTLLQQQKEQTEKALHELKATQAQLIQSEKMASLGELTAGIAHEIQNPLNFVNNFSETNVELLTELREEISKGNFEEANALATDVIENEQKIAHHGRRAEAIVRNMLEHSRSSKGEKQDTDVNALADEYLRLAYHGFRAKDKSFNAALETNFDASLGKVNIVPQEIGRVLLNLFNNAFYAVGEKKKHTGDSYEPAVAVSTKKLNDKVEIMVKDNGTGIPQRAIDKILQPFFTTKPTGQGTGLGLSLSYDIVKAHGGELKVESTEGEGTIFTVLLPLS